MRSSLALALVALGLLVSAATAAVAASSDRAAAPRYVFSVKTGLNAARIGAPTSGYLTVFRDAVRLQDLGADVCYGIAYAVSSAAQRARKPDLELYCGDEARITEAHFASSAFCSTGGTCVGTPGSLRKLADELKAAATVLPNTECVDGSGGCTSLEATFGPTHVSVRSANCRKFKSVAAIGPQCVATDVMIYREA